MSSIEPLIRQYAAAFDGTPKTSFPIELFDSLFATSFHITKEEFNPGFEQKLENKWMHTTIDREQVKSTHEAYMSKGTSLTLVHCNEIGIGLVDCEFMLKNADEETKVRLVFTIRDHKIVHAKTVDSSTAVLRAQVGETLSMFWKFGEAIDNKIGFTQMPAAAGHDMNRYHPPTESA